MPKGTDIEVCELYIYIIYGRLLQTNESGQYSYSQSDSDNLIALHRNEAVCAHFGVLRLQFQFTGVKVEVVSLAMFQVVIHRKRWMKISIVRAWAPLLTIVDNSLSGHYENNLVIITTSYRKYRSVSTREGTSPGHVFYLEVGTCYFGTIYDI